MAKILAIHNIKEGEYIMCCKNNNLYKFVVISSILILVFLLITVIILAINNTVSKTQNILTAIAKEGDNTEVGNVNIKFNENKIVVGNAITHEEGSDEININETGFYQISYQLNGIEQAISTFNFNAILIVNNVPLLEETLNEGPVLRENVSNNRMTLTSTVILELQAGDVLKLAGLSIEDITYNRARIDIEKI